MKRTLLCLTILVAALQLSQARILTLCNMPYSPGMYTTFSEAQNNANAGDTIYVHGSSINYGSITVDRPLVIIGAGHHPNKQIPLVSSFIDININSIDIQLIGLTFNHLNTSYYSNGVIKKCRIIGSGGTSGTGSALLNLYNPTTWLIEGNIFDSPNQDPCIYGGGYLADNLIIQNNIFATYGVKISNVYNNATERSYILNNIFLGDNSNYAFYNVTYANVENNVFYASSPGGQYYYNIDNSIMNNNISYQCYDNSFSQPGINNLVDVDPQFVSYAGPPALFDYTSDFSLASSSPGHNTGSDGTDRGVFGGIGFKFSTTGEPSIAEITVFTITSPTTVAPGGSLNISITSKRVH